MTEKLVVKYAEAAAMLSVTPQTIKTMVKKGRLKGVSWAGGNKCGGIPIASLKAFAEGGKPC